MSKDLASIEKLNNTNFANWAFKMENLLTKDELFKFVLEDPPETPDAAYLKYSAKDKAIMNLCFEDSQIIQVTNLQTPKHVWDKLKSVHQRANLSSKLFLLKNSQKLPEGGDMNTHINNILIIRDRLSAIGEEINESHIVGIMLCSLPQSYASMIRALETRDESDLKLEFVNNK